MNAHRDFCEIAGIFEIGCDDLLAASAQQIDLLWIQAGEPMRSRRVWRAARDRFYRHLLFEDGLDSLTSAGFVDDKASVHSLPVWAEQAKFLTTPVHLAKQRYAQASREGRRPAVVLSTGAYSPVHPGHLSVLECAREAIERETGALVVAGYLSASHDAYVQRKGEGHRIGEQRLRLIEVACAGSDWIMSDPWEARHIGGAVNFTDVIEHLETYLAQHLGAVDVWYAFGADNSSFARAFARAGQCVIVQRQGGESAIEYISSHPDVAAAMRERRILVAPAQDHASISSTLIRDNDHPMDEVATQIAAWERPHTGWYALRNDLKSATTHWNLTPSASDAVEIFAQEVKSILQSHFDEHGDQLTVEMISVQEQYRALEISSDQIHLDVWAPDGSVRLDLCRHFGLSDGQVRAQGLGARPEHMGAEHAASLIKPGNYSLVDDDISTGQTMAYAQKLLEQCEIIGSFSLLDYSRAQLGYKEREYDVVDARDFLLGASYSGLVCEQMRAPYMQPYTRLAARAKTAPDSEVSLSIQMWQANQRLFASLAMQGRALQISDCPSPCQLLLKTAGLELDDDLQKVCQWHIQRLYNPPFRKQAHSSIQASHSAATADQSQNIIPHIR